MVDASYKTLYGKHFKRTFVLFCFLGFLCSNPEKAEFIEQYWLVGILGHAWVSVHD